MITPLARIGTASTAPSPEFWKFARRSSDTRVAASASASAVAIARPSATARPSTPTPGGSTWPGWK